MMRKRNCSEWRTLKKPVGKAAYFTNVFTNFAGTNMRKYETIWENTLETHSFGIVQKTCKIKHLRRNTEHLRSYGKMIKILFICHGRKWTHALKCWRFLEKIIIVWWIYRGFTENQIIDKKSSAKKLKNRLIISHNLYILWVEVNVCRLLMVRGISDSVRKWCHLLYRWDINGIVCKCSPSADVGGEFA